MVISTLQSHVCDCFIIFLSHNLEWRYRLSLGTAMVAGLGGPHPISSVYWAKAGKAEQ